jgi:hypothetical protein
MKKQNRIKNLRKLLTARGIYDATPDSNIERLNKEIVDLVITKKPELIKELDKKKREKKEKPIRTSLLLAKRR